MVGAVESSSGAGGFLGLQQANSRLSAAKFFLQALPLFLPVLPGAAPMLQLLALLRILGLLRSQRTSALLRVSPALVRRDTRLVSPMALGGVLRSETLYLLFEALDRLRLLLGTVAHPRVSLHGACHRAMVPGCQRIHGLSASPARIVVLQVVNESILLQGADVSFRKPCRQLAALLMATPPA